ncbi:hypothetical protein, partial [Stenotrophomonas maltophilia]|uniref:hypothetical protein n=1 Tax=Stenotrophomonas maltophilia TaxID=40324 RepID=UPI00313BF55D
VCGVVVGVCNYCGDGVELVESLDFGMCFLECVNIVLFLCRYVFLFIWFVCIFGEGCGVVFFGYVLIFCGWC